jgi:hypothetical protein
MRKTLYSTVALKNGLATTILTKRTIVLGLICIGVAVFAIAIR